MLDVIGDKVTAKEAHNCGLISKLINKDQLMQEALKTAKLFVSYPKVTPLKCT